MPRTGSVLSSDPRAKAQAASIGATISPDGWWYKDGKRLTPQEADALTQQAGSAIGGLSDEGHGQPGGFRIGGDVGALWERNKGDIAKYGLPVAGAVLGGPLLGAAGGALGKIPGVGAVTDWAKGLTIPGLGGVSDALKGALPKLGGLLPKNAGGGIDLLGLGAIGKSAYLGDKASNFAKLAGESADREWARRAPVRDAGLAGMTAAPRRIPALGAIRTSGANPFAVAAQPPRPRPTGEDYATS